MARPRAKTSISERVGADSLLDIGAGSGTLAQALSRQVGRYRAIEQDPASADKLQRLGLDVIRGEFPFPLQETYDLVLSSHSVPEHSIEAYPAFLRAAWGATGKQGMLLIVTFKGSGGSLAALRSELLDQVPEASLQCESILTHCEEFGVTRIRRVNSYIETTTAEEMAEYLGSWIQKVLQNARAHIKNWSRP